MKIEININTDNAAFQENETELYNILERVAMAVSDGEKDGNLMDTNGNRVGNYKATK